MYEIVNKSLADKSILCAKVDTIERKDRVQKKLNLERIIDCCKYFPDNWASEGYVPLTFGITVRDLHTNKVLVKRVKEDNVKRTFIFLKDIKPVQHTGYDLVMYLSSIGVTGLLKNRDLIAGFSRVMSESVFDVNGLLWLEHNTEPNCILLDPMVMSTIYVDSNKFIGYISNEWKFENICDIKKEDGFIKCLIDDLVEIKEENNNE